MSEAITHSPPGGALDAAIERRCDTYFSFLAHLVREPSLAGGERPAQELVAAHLEALGFATHWIELTEGVSGSLGAGVPIEPVAGRAVLVGERKGDSPTSLVLNGHIDVVPPGDASLWTSPPFTPTVADGWLRGRGAGDMKGGLAMALLALRALHDTDPGALDARLTFVVVPEEESSGNGTLASILAGVRGDVALFPEPTDLAVLVSGVGVLWCSVSVRGGGAHAGSGTRSVNPLDKLLEVVDRVRGLEASFAALSAHAGKRGQSFRVNLGSLTAGDWPSSVPASARARLRVGFPEELTVADAEAIVRETIGDVVREDQWLTLHPPVLEFRGLRAEPHFLDPTHGLVQAVRTAHTNVHGSDPGVVHGSATSDARFYLNQAGMPAVCYGPRTRNMHGIDEAVDLSSIVEGARTLTRLLPALLASPPGTFR